MSGIVESLTLGLIFGIAIVGGSGGDDASAYLAGGDGPKRLKETLSLREQQGGIAGETGTIRTIEPDGKWRLEEFRTDGGKDQLTTIKTGRLAPAELEALAGDFAARDFLGLPEKVGAEEPVNPHKIIIQFGKKRTTLAGVAPRLDGDEPTKALIRKSAAAQGLAEDKVWARFADLADRIEASVAPPRR